MKLVLGVAFVLGCQHQSAVGTTTTTAAVTVLNDIAAENVAYARCTHENACNNIGEGQKWESLGACTTAERSVATSVIGQDTCPRGIDGHALQTCMNAIDRSPCLSGLPGECNKQQLCF